MTVIILAQGYVEENVGHLVVEHVKVSAVMVAAK